MLKPYQQVIADTIKSHGKVIDIGCGKGALLAWLRDNKQVQGHGIEIEADRVAEGVANGLSLIQGNADRDLQYYPDKGFDTAILSLTMQVMRQPREVLEQALRIAGQVVVVIPNFGQIQTRLYLLLKGRMPVTKELSYQWYETPNIHFCTIKDMVSLAEELRCTIERRVYLDKQGKAHDFCKDGAWGANLFGEYGVFVLRK